MTRKRLPAADAFADWRRDPAYVAAYDGLQAEFALTDALIRARAAADLTQAEVAARMGTTQAAIARLESGRSLPSTRTLQRFAEATGSRLEIRFVRRDGSGA